MTALNAPPASTERKLMTADEFLAFTQRPENADKWFELVRGEVIELPPPGRAHGAVAGNIARILGKYTFQRRKGYVTTDSGVLLEQSPDTVRGPDVALLEDAAKFVDVHPKYGEVPPVLVVEILSPSDTHSRVVRKTQDYLTSGVKLVWVVNYEEKTVEVYRHDRSFAVFATDAELSAEDVLPGFRCSVADFFFIPG